MKPTDNKKPLTTVPVSNPPAVANPEMTEQQVLGQVALIQQIMGACMKDGEHYGTIPGCGDKPTLLKPGAEKLCLTFRMAPTYEVIEANFDRAHREYRVTCALTSILTGVFLGQGVGICSTLEAKYRYRGTTAEPTDKPVPRAYWDIRADDPAKAQELIGGKGFSVKKVEGKGWMIAKGGERAEHDNPADNYNTVLKMAKKRALVDAVLTCTSASDIFSQDLEDITANIANYQPAPVQTAPNSAQNGAALPPEGASEGGDSGNQAKQLETANPRVCGASYETQIQFEPADDPQPAPAGDWGETRIHFGKNRGLMLSELTAQQILWYVNDWLQKKEVNGPTSTEDLQLINALKLWQRGKAALDKIAVELASHKISPSQFEDFLRARGDEITRLGALLTGQLEDLAAAMPGLIAEMVERAC